MAFNSVVVQNLTYTETSLGNLPTVTYTNGGVAGAEVVTVSGSPANISVSIESGVSTANQIKAAVKAHFIANQLVTVTGSSTAAQVSCVNAALIGGVDAAKATLTIGGTLKLTAPATGTSANSVTFKFVGGGTAGSELVTVSTNDITCQIEDGVSTYQQVKDAYDAVSDATTLAVTSSAGLALSGMDSSSTDYGIIPIVATSPIGVAYVAHMPTATHLAGGAAAVAAALVNQGVTYTAASTGVAGNLLRVTLIGGGTAGAEVVTETATSLTITIQIGSSTVTQIVTATAGTIYFAVTGSASTHPLTVNALVMSNGTGLNSRAFYTDNTLVTLTTSYQQFSFPDQAQTMVITNDETSGSKVLIFSLDGSSTAGTLLPTQSLTLDDLNGIGGIALKESGGAPAYRLYVIGK